MSETRIRRSAQVSTATVGTSTADASSILMAGMAGGVLSFESAPATAATALTFYAADAAGGPFVQLHDNAGAAVTVKLTTTTGVAYALPWEIAGCDTVRIVSDVALGTAATARVALKG